LTPLPGADPMSRARAREAAGLHKLRKGRDPCTARRRDGRRCLAPSVAGAAVCRRHGGAAPQVLIAARHLVLMEAFWGATREYEAARGTPGEFDALCRWSAAEEVLGEYRSRLARLAELRAAVRAQTAAAASGARQVTS
jgi:hypothetical protein